MALIHQEASEDFLEKSAGRAAFNSDLVDIAGTTGGAEVVGEAVGATGMMVLGLDGGTIGLGLLEAFWGLLVLCDDLLEVLRGLLRGVLARGGESISMSEGSLLFRENSPF